MDSKDFNIKADCYLRTICGVKPNRRTGSSGNRDATDFFVKTIRSFGYKVDETPFESQDYLCRGATLSLDNETFEVQVSPYSLGCNITAELVVVSSVEELEQVDCKGKILLMKDAICAEQLMPKNFIFYNPEHHQKIITLLERRQPAGIITATARKPEQVGALYPFPLIVDGDFDIPSVYCRDSLGDALAVRKGERFRLTIDTQRIRAQATNPVAQLNAGAASKLVLTAHIDAYETALGASDNASGTTILLLCAEMLSNYQGKHCIEIIAFNGEDHYSAGGQMDYLNRYRYQLPRILLAVNADGVGYKHGKSAYSFYECPAPLEQKSLEVFQNFNGLILGEPWFSGDHMIFVQNQIAAIAFTSEYISDLMNTATHTLADAPEIIDCRKLVEIANALTELFRLL